MKNFLVFALASVCIANPATAATGGITYLTCTMNGNPFPFALNESAGTVSYIHRTGVVFEKAAFTADSVVWEAGATSYSKVRYTIDRIDLSLSLAVGGEVTQRETCTIVQSPDRKF